MRLISWVLLPLLPALAAAQEIPEFCSTFSLEVTSLEFTWLNWVNGTNVTVAEGEIWWGRAGIIELGPSGMIADANSESFPKTLTTTSQFTLGQLSHYNFPIYRGGGITGVELKVMLETTFGPMSFIYDLEVHETPNKEGECPYPSPDAPCSDRILVVNDPTPQSVMTMDGKTFEIDLLGFRIQPNRPTVNQFISQEQGTNSARLYGGLYLEGCPRVGGGMGDPHFQTWSGHWYDFHGACDLHLVHAPNFAPGLPLTIDVRTKTRNWYSFIERAAIQIGDEILEVAAFGDYQLNGVSGFGDYFNGVEGLSLAGYLLTYSNPEPNVHMLEIAIAGNEKIVVRSFKDMVSVKIQDAHKDRFQGSSGMMGDFHTGQVFARDNSTILEDPPVIAREWQVREDEPMLFQAIRAPQYPETCVMPKKQLSDQRRLGKTVAVDAAQKACAKWSADTRDLCIQDVLRTGDLSLAKEHF